MRRRNILIFLGIVVGIGFLALVGVFAYRAAVNSGYVNETICAATKFFCASGESQAPVEPGKDISVNEPVLGCGDNPDPDRPADIEGIIFSWSVDDCSWNPHLDPSYSGMAPKIQGTSVIWNPEMGDPSDKALSDCAGATAVESEDYVNHVLYKCLEIKAWIANAKAVSSGAITNFLDLPAAAVTVTDQNLTVTCNDGEFISDEADDQGLPRMPVIDGARAVIVEVAHFGDDFGSLDRAVFVFPAGGTYWQVNLTKGAATMSVRAFCGTPDQVAQWAVTHHVPSLQQASRDPNGDQPKMSEIGVYLVNYEDHTMTTIKDAPDGPTPADLLTWFDVSFHDGDNFANVPIQLAK